MVKKEKAAAGKPAVKEGFQRSGEGEIWNPQNPDNYRPGEVLEGELIDIGDYVNKKSGKPNKIYKVRTADGKVHTVFGTARLNRGMTEVKKGAQVLITYLGKEKTAQGSDAHNFDVQYKQTPF